MTQAGVGQLVAGFLGGSALQVDPLASVDVDKLNASYLQRHQASLLGVLASMPAIRNQAV